MQRMTARRNLAIAGLVLLAATALTGCGGETNSSTGDNDGSTSPGDSTGNSQGSATMSLDDREFSFDLQFCSVVEQDDIEIMLHGPGTEADSDIPGYLDGASESLDGSFRVDIGTDKKFQSMDDFIELGTVQGGPMSIESVGKGYLITANAWNDQGDDLGTGTLRFSCD